MRKEIWYQEQPSDSYKNDSQHIESVHEKIKPFKCKVCENSFTRNSGLRSHIKNVHEKIVKLTHQF